MDGWMFSEAASLQNAGPTFLLTPVGWVLLCNLGLASKIKEPPSAGGWGIDLPAFCFGMAVYTFGLAVVSVLQNMPNTKTKGSPALFLLIAPPALAAGSLRAFNGGVFGIASTCAFGTGLFLELTVLRLSHNVLQKPKVIGQLAGFTLAPAAMGNAAIAYANQEDSDAAKTVAVVLVLISTLLMVGAWTNAVYHQILYFKGKHVWVDPLVGGFLKSQESVVKPEAESL